MLPIYSRSPAALLGCDHCLLATLSTWEWLSKAMLIIDLAFPLFRCIKLSDWAFNVGGDLCYLTNIASPVPQYSGSTTPDAVSPNSSFSELSGWAEELRGQFHWRTLWLKVLWAPHALTQLCRLSGLLPLSCHASRSC